MSIKKALDAALAKQWMEDMTSPEAIRMNPQDLAGLAQEFFDNQERTNIELEPYWPASAARNRKELEDFRKDLAERGGVAATISKWINPYAGGVPIDVIPEASVKPGTVELVAA